MSPFGSLNSFIFISVIEAVVVCLTNSFIIFILLSNCRTDIKVAPCHLIVCDSSSLGVQLADKLIEGGIKNLHLHVYEYDGSLRYQRRLFTVLTFFVGHL